MPKSALLLFTLLVFTPALLHADPPNGFSYAMQHPSNIHWLYPTCVAASQLDAAGAPYRVLIIAIDERHYEASCLYKAGKFTFSYGEHGSRTYNRPFESNPGAQTWQLSRSEVLQLARDHDSIPGGCLVQATAAYYQHKHDPRVLWAGLINSEVTSRPEIINNGMGMNFAMARPPQGHSIDAFETVDHQIFVEENGESPVRIKSQSAPSGWRNANYLAQVLHENKDSESQSSFIDQFSR
jgi:hypothetical protein